VACFGGRVRVQRGEHRGQPLGAPVQHLGELGGLQHEHVGQGGGELRVLLPGLGQHLLQPAPRRLPPGLGDLVHRPLGIARITAGLAHGDQARGEQPLDGPVQAGALLDVDDLVLPPLPDQPLDAVGMQRLVVQQGQHGQGQR
jgi:hypothetical protein